MVTGAGDCIGKMLGTKLTETGMKSGKRGIAGESLELCFAVTVSAKFG